MEAAVLGDLHQTQTPDHVVHHIANAAALGVPFMSIIMNLSPILSAILTLCGIGWYVLLYIDRRRRIKKEKQAEQSKGK